jgi:hypothetical protein
MLCEIRQTEPGMLTHACPPGYLGIGDWEICGLKTAQKKVTKSPSQTISWALWLTP